MSRYQGGKPSSSTDAATPRWVVVGLDDGESCQHCGTHTKRRVLLAPTDGDGNPEGIPEALGMVCAAERLTGGCRPTRAAAIQQINHLEAERVAAAQEADRILDAHRARHERGEFGLASPREARVDYRMRNQTERDPATIWTDGTIYFGYHQAHHAMAARWRERGCRVWEPTP